MGGGVSVLSGSSSSSRSSGRMNGTVRMGRFFHGLTSDVLTVTIDASWSGVDALARADEEERVVGGSTWAIRSDLKTNRFVLLCHTSELNLCHDQK